MIKLFQIAELMDTPTLRNFSNGVMRELRKVSNQPGRFKRFRLFFVALLDNEKTR